MCGRFTIRKPVTKTVDIVKTNIKVEDSDNYNAHPTQKLPIIKSYTNGKALELCEWWLVPNLSKKLDKFSPLINARKETLMEKVTFKNLIQTSRCIVPADGYYEWKREDKTKTPFYFSTISVLLNVLISVYYFKDIGFIIIPIATSISSWINSILLYIYLHKENYFKFSNKIIIQIIRITVSTIIMGLCLQILLSYFESQLSFENNYKFIYLFFLVILSILIYFIVSLITKAFKLSDIKIKY